MAGEFILTAVARKNLARSYELTHPDLRQGLSLTVRRGRASPLVALDAISASAYT